MGIIIEPQKHRERNKIKGDRHITRKMVLLWPQLVTFPYTMNHPSSKSCFLLTLSIRIPSSFIFKNF